MFASIRVLLVVWLGVSANWPIKLPQNTAMILGIAAIALTDIAKAKIGSLSSKYEHFIDWKRLEEDEPGVVDLETMLKGVCAKANFIDILENSILFEDLPPYSCE